MKASTPPSMSLSAWLRPLWMMSLLAGSLPVLAQQDPLYTMYMWNIQAINPGYAGSADLMNITAVARRQWVGFTGAPETNSLMIHTPLARKTLGAGLSFVNDEIGPTVTNSVHADLVYRLRVNSRSRLAFGLKAGGTMLNTRYSSLNNTDANDLVYQRDVTGGFRPNFGFGLYYWNRNGYIGLSCPRLVEDRFVKLDGNGDQFLGREHRHAFLVAGHVFKIHTDIRFRPSLTVKAVEGAPLTTDLTANFLFRERLWAGLSYRTDKTLGLIASYQVREQLRIGYAYELGLSELRHYHGGSHEIMITYDLSFTKNLVRSPRYF